jgi:hypothetical protein
MQGLNRRLDELFVKLGTNAGVYPFEPQLESLRITDATDFRVLVK